MELVWSRRAIADLCDLRRYSRQRWGPEITARYVAELEDSARRVAARPVLARPMREALSYLRVRSHYLVFRIEPGDRIMVARVLHVAMDIERHLD